MLYLAIAIILLGIFMLLRYKKYLYLIVSGVLVLCLCAFTILYSYTYKVVATATTATTLEKIPGSDAYITATKINAKSEKFTYAVNAGSILTLDVYPTVLNINKTKTAMPTSGMTYGLEAIHKKDANEKMQVIMNVQVTPDSKNTVESSKVYAVAYFNKARVCKLLFGFSPVKDTAPVSSLKLVNVEYDFTTTQSPL